MENFFDDDNNIINEDEFQSEAIKKLEDGGIAKEAATDIVKDYIERIHKYQKIL